MEADALGESLWLVVLEVGEFGEDSDGKHAKTERAGEGVPRRSARWNPTQGADQPHVKVSGESWGEVIGLTNVKDSSEIVGDLALFLVAAGEGLSRGWHQGQLAAQREAFEPISFSLLSRY